MNKHQLQNNNKKNKTKRKVLATSAQNKWGLGVCSLPIPFKPKMETVIHEPIPSYPRSYLTEIKYPICELAKLESALGPALKQTW